MNIKTPELTDLPALQSLWQEAFGDTLEFINTFFQTAFDCSRCFCAVDKGVITAAIYWFDCEYHNRPVAYLYAIATAKAYQGQGICHKLMAHTHDHLRKTGYVGAVLVPGNAGLFDFYRSMGYDTCCFVKEFHCSATPQVQPSAAAPDATAPCHSQPELIAAELGICQSGSLSESSLSRPELTVAEFEPQPCPITERAHIQLQSASALGSAQVPLNLRPLTKTEYATLRRQFLPKDGIIQENICLDFLQLQAQLFAGDDFILAAHAENNRLFVPELLGNSTHALQILQALNCTKGHFRTPGTEKPFAMYLSLLENDLPLPTHFGLAFD